MDILISSLLFFCSFFLFSFSLSPGRIRGGAPLRRSGGDPQEWKPLADQGDADAQYNLGLMYDYGYGVAEDDAEAARWYRLAADQGHAIAQYNLGLMYASGRGVVEDDAEAVAGTGWPPIRGTSPSTTSV